MKCTECGKSEYAHRKISDELALDGGPVVKVKGLDALVCPKCGDVLMDAATSERKTKLVLAALINEYSPSLQIPAKVAVWMRKAIALSAEKWAEIAGGVGPSSFGQAEQLSLLTDRYAAFLLLAHTTDFVSDTRRGSALIQATHDLGKHLDPEILRLVEVDASDSSWREPVQDLIDKYSERGAALRGARVKEGITQAALAKKLKISASDISAMERGKRPIGKAMAQRLAKILKINYRVFL